MSGDHLKARMSQHGNAAGTKEGHLASEDVMSQAGVATVKVLFVDDDPGLRRAAARVFERCGIPSAVAEDGDEALRLLVEQANFRVVVADVHMPGTGGLGLLREARRMGVAPRFIITSGSLEPEDLDGADGLVEFLAKPWTPSQLVERVESLLAAGEVDR